MRRLHVGPHSAGADPGPVCYGRGGLEATVTDADLILGYLDPGFFLGGEMALDVDAARQAVTLLGAELGLDPARGLFHSSTGHWGEANRIVEAMEDQGREVLAKTPPAAVQFRRLADMRYRKQGYEICVPVPAGRLRKATRDEIRNNFEDAYTTLYGHTMANAPIDIVPGGC